MDKTTIYWQLILCRVPRFLFTAWLAGALGLGGVYLAQAQVQVPQALVPQAQAQIQTQAQAIIASGWARPSIADRPGVAYLTLTNRGTDDRLLVVTSPTSAKIEIHSHKMQNNIMRMRRLDALPLPANSTTTMAPHGNHLMLFGLAKPLTENMALPLTLYFEKTPPLTLTIRVQNSPPHSPSKQE
ncbi:MAG: copper chaperone PCu(A)C [Alphaproteobacteria bacterium]|nr:copper chaperone PCu(A)C [Alphaproteobacteria bacterium]